MIHWSHWHCIITKYTLTIFIFLNCLLWHREYHCDLCFPTKLCLVVSSSSDEWTFALTHQSFFCQSQKRFKNKCQQSIPKKGSDAGNIQNTIKESEQHSAYELNEWMYSVYPTPCEPSRETRRKRTDVYVLNGILVPHPRAQTLSPGMRCVVHHHLRAMDGARAQITIRVWGCDSLRWMIDFCIMVIENSDPTERRGRVDTRV